MKISVWLGVDSLTSRKIGDQCRMLQDYIPDVVAQSRAFINGGSSTVHGMVTFMHKHREHSPHTMTTMTQVRISGGD